MGELLIRMVFSLAFVVGLLILISRVAATRFQGRSGSAIEVLHRQALSKSASVAVVSVAGRVLVLGTTEQAVSVLTELDPTELDPTELDLTGLDPTGLNPTGLAVDSEAHLNSDDPVAGETWEELDPVTYGEPLPVPSLELLLSEPDQVALEELCGHRPPATATATADVDTDADPVLPEDPSYAAFAAQLRAQLASGTYSEPTPATVTVTAAPSGVPGAVPGHTGRQPAPRMDPPPATPAAPAATPRVTGPVAADVAHLRAALLAARVQANATPARASAPSIAPPVADSPLTGSLLSPATWRQALRAVSRPAS